MFGGRSARALGEVLRGRDCVVLLGVRTPQHRAVASIGQHDRPRSALTERRKKCNSHRGAAHYARRNRSALNVRSAS
jgi:hypothetical protein